MNGTGREYDARMSCDRIRIAIGDITSPPVIPEPLPKPGFIRGQYSDTNDHQKNLVLLHTTLMS